MEEGETWERDREKRKRERERIREIDRMKESHGSYIILYHIISYPVLSSYILLLFLQKKKFDLFD